MLKDKIILRRDLVYSFLRQREEPMSSNVYTRVIFAKHAVIKFKALGYAE